jgi:hypothetical protein
MSVPSDLTPNDDETLAVPGVVCVTPTASGRKVVYAGASAGWMVPRGIMAWAHELACIARADAPLLVGTLKATQPHEQIAPKKFPMAKRAADVSPLLAVSTSLAAEARDRGVRVHTIGVDRVSAGFYYFGEGGPGAPVRAQGNLIDMLAPSLTPSSTNAEIQALLDSLIDRLLRELSGGVISELDVELANALPRFSKDGTGLEETDIEAFDRSARNLSLESAHLDSAARELVAALAEGTRRGQSVVAPVALYGEARRESRAALRLKVGDKTLQLAAQTFWTVAGTPRENVTELGATPPIPVVIERTTAPPAAVARTTVPAPAERTPATPLAAPERTPAPRPKVSDAPARAASPSPPVVDRTAPIPRPAAVFDAGSALTPAPTHVIVDPSPRPAPVATRQLVPAPVTASGPAPVLTPAPPAAVPVSAAASGPSPERQPAPAAVAEAPAPAPDRAPPSASELSPERKSVPADPIPLVRRGPRATPKPVEPAAGTSMVAVLLALVAAAIGYFIYRARHTGHF